ncbi:MAG: ABC transporter ATP-binding protein [Nitrososphaerota archaeon]|nr:ABC transporter ATP-binding protein [Candidatus Bathyarchaeota archaeon]MDW8061117.1 ABC transporter ATP-binding protein [Nitrososphaerota archaeon]
MKAVEVVNLVKVYGGGIPAIDNLTFAVEPGEIYGLIGPNGAGKTTTLRIVATLIKPTSGSVRVLGFDVVDQAEYIRRMISYLPEEAGVYGNLTGYEYLRFIADIYAKSGDESESMIEEALEISGLGSRIKDRVKSYSRGMRRRLQVARTLMVKPKLAILDEPTSGLDVYHAHYIRRCIRRYVDEYGLTVLISSHNMLEIEYLCDRILLIHRGRSIDDGPPRILKEKYSSNNMEEVFLKAVGLT